VLSYLSDAPLMNDLLGIDPFSRHWPPGGVINVLRRHRAWPPHQRFFHHFTVAHRSRQPRRRTLAPPGSTRP
jgi:hypothetical protein